MASRRKHSRKRPRDATDASGKKTKARLERYARPRRPPTPGPVRLIESDRLWPAVWMGLSAVLFFFCFPQKLGPIEIELGPLAFVCLVPFVLGAVSIRGTCRGGLWAMLAGWAAMLAGVYWIIWITAFGSLLLGWQLSWYWIILYGVIRWTKRRLPAVPLAVTVPLVWVSLEFVRAFMLTGFGWLYLAHSQFRVLGLIQISDVFGAYGVSVLVAAVNGLIADAVIVWRQRRAPLEVSRPSWRPVLVTAAVVGALLGGTLAYGGWRLASLPIVDGPKLAAVQGRIPQQLGWQADHASDPNIQTDAETALERTDEIFEHHLELTDAALEEHKDDPPVGILWPETTFMVDGGLNAYSETLREIYLADVAVEPSPSLSLDDLHREAWWRFRTLARRAVEGKLTAQEKLLLRASAWRVFGSAIDPDAATRPAPDPALIEKAWTKFRNFFRHDLPPAHLEPFRMRLHTESWRWFRAMRSGEIAAKVQPILDRAREHGSHFLLGATAFTRQIEGKYVYHRRRNAVFLVKPASGIQPEFYIKRHLVPFGEYLPFKKSWPWLYETILSFSPIKGPDGKPRDHSSVPGEKDVFFSLPARKANEPACRFAAPICFEITVPRVCRRFVLDPSTGTRRVDFLVNLSNDGWFEGTSEHMQHLSSAVFRAVENRVGVVRAVNTGISGFISPTGRTYGLLAPSETGVSTHRVQYVAGHEATVYTRAGDVFAWGISILAGILLLTNGALAFAAARQGREEPNADCR